MARDARAQALGRLSKSAFDLLVVGGGILGAGVARDAALRGLKVALVERGDFGQGTSSRSSKMVHGGLRYLEQRAFGLVSEACAERRVLQRIAPHLVRPRSFVVPAYRGQRPSRLELEAGMWIYDAVALFRNTRMHRPLSARALSSMEPGLRRDDLAGGGLFFDCVTDDARLTLANVLDAAALGATVLNYAEVRAIDIQGDKVRGATVFDGRADREVQVKARAVVNAAGPWSDAVSKLADPGAPSRVRLTKGAHIVVPRARLNHVRALVLRAPQDWRVFFAVPWGDLTLVGTTDTDFDGSPDEVRVEPEDVKYLTRAAAHYFPASDLTAEDVVGAYAGLRPLIRVGGVAPSEVPREHSVAVGPRGFVTVVGGKLTTYRRIARQVVDEASLSAGLGAKGASTAKRKLPGGRAQPAQPAAAAAAIGRTWGVAEEEADALYWLHGSEVGAVLEDSQAAHRARLCEELPYLGASAVWAFRFELAVTLEDALVRRVPLSLRLRDGGASIAQGAAKLVSNAAGWDADQREAEVEAFLKRVERESGWRRGV